MKKAIIIGAGITGLSAGINALLKGYEVEIYEKNESSGGCCGGWFRSNYYIDNCMHWLTGTNQHTKLFKLWKKLGAMDETSNLYQGHYFYKSFYEGESISLYSNTEKVRNEMIRLSPEDRKEIDMFINTVNYFVKLNQKDNFIKNLFNKANAYRNIILKYHKLSLNDLSNKFKHPLLKKLFTDYFPGSYSSLSFIYSYATFASGNGKVYSNGSLVFSKNIEQRFIDLGGKIFFNSEVLKINIKNDIFESITLKNNTVKGDVLISCIDPFYLFDHLLDNSYLPKKLNEKKAYKNENPIISSFHCAYLINKSDLNFKDSIVFEIPKIQIGLTPINRLFIKEYSYLNPDSDKVLIQTFIIQNMVDYDYWEQLQCSDNNEYLLMKQNLGYKLLDILVSKNPNYKNNIELLDTWTPITYKNYFNSYYGSYMGFVLKKNCLPKKLSPKIPGLKNIFYLSYWQDLMGGLPIAAKLGESIIKYL